MLKTQDDCIFTRNVCCALIKCAIEDCQNEKIYERANTNNHAEVNRHSAVRFLKSKAFEEICMALGLPADKFKKRAFR